MGTAGDGGEGGEGGEGGGGPTAPNLNVSAPITINTIASPVNGASGSSTLTLTTAASFAAGQTIIVHQSVGNGAGNWERNTIKAVNGVTVTLATSLAHAYSSAGTDRAQAVVVPEYGNVTESGGSITAPAWDGNTGGILALIATSTMTINDANGITMAGKGYAGGTSSTVAPSGGPSFTRYKMPGGSYLPLGYADTTLYQPNKGGGGGGGMRVNCVGSPGGGGGYALPGTPGGFGGGCAGGTIFGGVGGEVYGDAALKQIFFGSGGGAGGYSSDPTQGHGGAGGGIVILYTSSIDVHVPQAINVDGAAGTLGFQGDGPGGGGAGGSIYLSHTSMVTGFSNLSANGALGGAAGPSGKAQAGGTGGSGRILVAP